MVEVDHFGQFVRKAKTRTCKATTDPVWDQVSRTNKVKSLHTSQVAHQAGAYPGFSSIKILG